MSSGSYDSYGFYGFIERGRFLPVKNPRAVSACGLLLGSPDGRGSWLGRQSPKSCLLAFPALRYRGRKANRGTNRWHNDQNRDRLENEREGRLSGLDAVCRVRQHLPWRRRQPRAYGAWQESLPLAVAGVSSAGRLRGNGMEYFLQQLINGLTLGGVYGLIAIGYTMVYGIIGMINFAHGDIYMIGAFNALICFLVLGYLGITWVPLAILIVLIVAVALTSVYGWTVERVAYRRLRGS
jgi:hypothetical protein